MFGFVDYSHLPAMLLIALDEELQSDDFRDWVASYLEVGPASLSASFILARAIDVDIIEPRGSEISRVYLDWSGFCYVDVCNSLHDELDY
jgi:hypothetical protein